MLQENKQIFIDIVTDGTGREYKGYYNMETEKYTLIFEENTKEEFIMTKHSSEIYDDLYDPFTELKAINQEV